MRGKKIITKVVIPANSQKAADGYLEEKVISPDLIYPDL